MEKLARCELTSTHDGCGAQRCHAVWGRKETSRESYVRARGQRSRVTDTDSSDESWARSGRTALCVTHRLREVVRGHGRSRLEGGPLGGSIRRTHRSWSPVVTDIIFIENDEGRAAGDALWTLTMLRNMGQRRLHGACTEGPSGDTDTDLTHRGPGIDSTSKMQDRGLYHALGSATSWDVAGGRCKHVHRKIRNEPFGGDVGEVAPARRLNRDARDHQARDARQHRDDVHGVQGLVDPAHVVCRGRDASHSVAGGLGRTSRLTNRKPRRGR